MVTDAEDRVYPLGEVASHLTGYVQSVTAEDLEERKGKGYDANSVLGKSGLESLYEDELRGTDRLQDFHRRPGWTGADGAGEERDGKRAGYHHDH